MGPASAQAAGDCQHRASANASIPANKPGQGNKTRVSRALTGLITAYHRRIRLTEASLARVLKALLSCDWLKPSLKPHWRFTK
jgi:hypothetical protein